MYKTHRKKQAQIKTEHASDTCLVHESEKLQHLPCITWPADLHQRRKMFLVKTQHQQILCPPIVFVFTGKNSTVI